MRKLLLLAFFFFFSCSPVDYSQIKVEEVIDGDTVVLSTGERLRYIGIDTPETWLRENDEFIYDPQPFSYQATQLNKKLVEGKIVRVEFDIRRKDHYGRLLGYCFVDDLFVNKELVRQGYAVLYTFVPNVKYVDLLVQAQKEAQAAGRGLWQDYKAIAPDQAHDYIGKIHTVKGKVVSTYESDQVIFLNFGPNYREDFTVVIFRSTADFFTECQLKPVDFYQGRILEVTGLIQEHNGPQIVINTPDQIRIIGD